MKTYNCAKCGKKIDIRNDKSNRWIFKTGWIKVGVTYLCRDCARMILYTPYEAEKKST